MIRMLSFICTNHIVMIAHTPAFLRVGEHYDKVAFPSYTKIVPCVSLNRSELVKAQSVIYLATMQNSFHYCPCMWEGNVFILSVCVCVSVQAISFECLDIETSFWYGDTELHLDHI